MILENGRAMGTALFMDQEVFKPILNILINLGTILAASGLYEGSDIIYATIPTAPHTHTDLVMDKNWYKDRW